MARESDSSVGPVPLYMPREGGGRRRRRDNPGRGWEEERQLHRGVRQMARESDSNLGPVGPFQRHSGHRQRHDPKGTMGSVKGVTTSALGGSPNPPSGPPRTRLSLTIAPIGDAPIRDAPIRNAPIRNAPVRGAPASRGSPNGPGERFQPWASGPLPEALRASSKTQSQRHDGLRQRRDH